jgi:radical SAM superfamily enzyme YgiQ (UPF0313 family)
MNQVVSSSRLIRRPATSKKRVLLITPPSSFLLDERVFMSLGILKIAAVLEQAGHSVELLDLSGIENYLDVVDEHIRRTCAEAVAVTVTTPQLPTASAVAERIKSIRPDLKIILGGPHVTLVSAAVKLEVKTGRRGRAHRALAKLEESFDVLVAGDGELAVFEALTDGAPKLVDGDDHRGPLFMDNAAYESSPFPARHLVDVNSYNYSIEGHRATSLIAQLGCPFACGFCGGRNSKALRMIRTRTTESVIKEMEMLHREYGFTGFMLYDDELNVNKGMVELMNAISDLQSRLGTEFRLRGFVKSELFNDEQAASMYRAGFRWILCGFEAASPKILENINKRATLDDNTKVMEVSDRHGLKVKALMSVGHPGESEQTILDVRDWLLKVKPADFDCTVISCFPGTPYYDESVPHESIHDAWTYTCKKSGDRLHSFDVDYSTQADYYKGDPSDGYKSFVFTDHLSGDEIVKLRNQVEDEVRSGLSIPFNPGKPGLRYEHSMGQGNLPFHILRESVR